MANFRAYDQEQGIFRTIVPNDLLDETDPARIISHVVEILDLTRIYARYSEQGNPPYHPKMMLKVLFYSYYAGFMSCRKMWDALQKRADMIYLSGDQVPDFRTLNRFRTLHMEEIPDIFTQISMLCAELDMVGLEHLAIDGQKIHANANYRKSMNKERLKKRYNKVKEGIKHLLATDPEDGEAYEKRDKRISNLRAQKERLEVVAQELKRMEESGAEDPTVNMTDPESPTMKHKDGRSLPSYNHISAVDEKFGVTVATKTTIKGDGPEDLLDLTDRATKNVGSSFESVTADSAFCDFSIIETIETKRPETFYVPDKRFDAVVKGETARGEYDKSNFIVSEDGTVICPEDYDMGIKNVTQGDGYTQTVYKGLHCGICEAHDACTPADFRTMRIDSREVYLYAMRERLLSNEGREIYRRRQAVVEPPHGHDQKNKGWRQHHLRGLDKATLEFLLMRIASNIGKIAKYKPEELLARTA